MIDLPDSPLMDEIEANLNDCKTEAQKERYLFSLLKPFGESSGGCGIARVYEPTAEINQLEQATKECEKDKAFWQTLPEDEQLKNVNGEPSGTPKEQVEACNDMCKRYKEQIDWVLYVNRQFIDLTCTDKAKEGSVERCLSTFVGVMEMFSNRLDALLLTYGIDLLRLQRECGIYLKEYRIITDVDFYIGSLELAQKYIDALPKELQQKQPEETPEGAVILPDVLNTDEAKKVLQKAIEAGLMSKEGARYKWHKTISLAACFAYEMSKKFQMGKGDRISWKPFEYMFGYKYGTLRRAYNDILKTGQNPLGIEIIESLFPKE